MKVLFAGGGTGGHINPALSIAGYAKKYDDDFEALFIGTKRGLETKLVPNAGFDIEYIDIRGFDRKNPFKNVEVLLKLHESKKKCLEIIKNFKPDCVVCTGGYVSGPVCMAAAKLGIPSLIHEQNVYPGFTVSASEKYVDYVAVSFEETLKHMKAVEKCVVTGNPVRDEIVNADREESRYKLDIKDDKPFVLIFGGSLGAGKINDTVIEMLPKIIEEKKFRVMFGTGDKHYSEIMEKIDNMNIVLGDDVQVLPYINKMDRAMSAADLVVCRSGAITVSELAVLLKPSILIPSPNVVRNHQEQNAREVEANGGAVVICEDELSSEKLYDSILKTVTNKQKLANMSNGLKNIRIDDANKKIFYLMRKMANQGK